MFVKSFRSAAALSVCLFLALGAAAQASITGVELGNSFQFAANSTNLLNFQSNAPGRPNQTAPHVLLVSSTANSITLDFFNNAPGQAFFEFRVDGQAPTGGTAHPIVGGDIIHSFSSSSPLGSFSTYGGISLAANTALPVQHTFTGVSNLVEVRLALGGEADWRFNWTAFELADAAVPEPATVAVWSLLGLCGSAVAWRARRRANG